MGNHIHLSLFDAGGRKRCDLYDSTAPAHGQAHDIVLTSQMNGWKELTFTLPYFLDGEKNWRNAYIRGETLVRLVRGGETDWFLLSAPSKQHKGLAASTEITCPHISSLLNKRGMALYFDDTNGIGTAQA